MSYTLWKDYAFFHHQCSMEVVVNSMVLPRLTEPSVGISERLISFHITLANEHSATLLCASALKMPSENQAKNHFYQLLVGAACWSLKSNKILLPGDISPGLC